MLRPPFSRGRDPDVRGRGAGPPAAPKRDVGKPEAPTLDVQEADVLRAAGDEGAAGRDVVTHEAVSYTHLTLPTICSV